MVSSERAPITVVTATGLEYAQARKALPRQIGVVRAGISLKSSNARITGIAISCGIAGGLRDDLPTGTVIVPRSIGRSDGAVRACDEELVDALTRAAQSIGCRVVNDPLLTSESFVRGARRSHFAQRGFAGVDMESASIHADRFACVRTILDTPSREISEAWLSGMRAAFTPRAWLDLPFLIKNGPRAARTAANVIAAAFQAA